MGLEPTAFCATNRRSNQLSYIRHISVLETEVIIPQKRPNFNSRLRRGGAWSWV